jgi:hypothetical protein
MKHPVDTVARAAQFIDVQLDLAARTRVIESRQVSELPRPDIGWVELGQPARSIRSAQVPTSGRPIGKPDQAADGLPHENHNVVIGKQAAKSGSRR